MHLSHNVVYEGSQSRKWGLSLAKHVVYSDAVLYMHAVCYVRDKAWSTVNITLDTNGS